MSSIACKASALALAAIGSAGRSIAFSVITALTTGAGVTSSAPPGAMASSARLASTAAARSGTALAKSTAELWG
jgi:hypothetical protein